MSIPFGLGWLALLRRAARRRARGPGARAASHGPRGDIRREPPVAILVLLALELVYLAATRTRGAWLGAAGGLAVFFALRWSRPGRCRARRWWWRWRSGAAALAAAVIPGRGSRATSPTPSASSPASTSCARRSIRRRRSCAPASASGGGRWRCTARTPSSASGPGNFAVLFPLYAEPGARADGVLTPIGRLRAAPTRICSSAWPRPGSSGWRRCWPSTPSLPDRRAPARARAAARRPGRPRPSPRRRRVRARRPGGARRRGRGVAGGAVRLRTDRLPAGDAGHRAPVRRRARRAGERGRGVAAPSPSARRAVAPAEPRSRRRALRSRCSWRLALVARRGGRRVARGSARSYWLARARAALRAARSAGPGSAGAPSKRCGAPSAPTPDSSRSRSRPASCCCVSLAPPRRCAPSTARWRSSPTRANAWALRAEADLGAGDAPQAAADADRATAILNDYPDAIATRGRAGQSTRRRSARCSAARDHLAALAAAGDERAARLLRLAGPGAGRATWRARSGGMKVALVHDWLVSIRGAEKVLESFCRIYPQADVFTLHHEADGVRVSPELGGARRPDVVHRSACRGPCRARVRGSGCCCRCSRWRSSRCASTATTW